MASASVPIQGLTPEKLLRLMPEGATLSEARKVVSAAHHQNHQLQAPIRINGGWGTPITHPGLTHALGKFEARRSSPRSRDPGGHCGVPRRSARRERPSVGGEGTPGGAEGEDPCAERRRPLRKVAIRAL
eukprot:1196181-Prorocentrum_minimum.AAC.13